MADSANATPFFDPPTGSPQNINSPLSQITLGGAMSGYNAQAAQIPEPIEWAKFCMWLRGYLNAIEGKKLTAEDSAKIMEKLATVDPESQLQRIYDPIPNPYIPQQPYNPSQPWATPQTGHPIWTIITDVSTGTSQTYVDETDK